MIFEHKIIKEVEFSHTDMAGIVHFSNFYKYMEAVEHDLFRSLGKSIVGERDSAGENLGWPRVQANCSFKAPLKFEDKVELHLIVRQLRSSTLRYEVIFTKLGEVSMVCARGEMTIVHVVQDQAGVMKARPLPEWLALALEAAPEGYKCK